MITQLVNFSIQSLLVLFLWIFAGSFGFPGGTLTILSFGSLSIGIYSLITIILISFIAASIGDILAYELARKLSINFKEKLRKFSFIDKNEIKSKELLDKYGFFIVFFTRFALINIGAVMSYISGFEKLNRKKYYIAVVSGEFLYALIYSIIGFAFGEVFSNLFFAINDIIIVLGLLALVFYIIRYYIKKRNKKRLVKIYI